MHKIVTVEEMRAIEQAGDDAGVSYDQMMDNAGRALADRVLCLLADQPTSRITVLVGSGNNGGDALVAGRLLAEESEHEVNFYLYKTRGESDRVFAPVKEAGLFVAQAADDQRYRVLNKLITTSHVIIDGLLGIGLTLPIKDNLAEFMEAVQQALQAAQRPDSLRTYDAPADPLCGPDPGPLVIAVDCPSGLDCDTGEADPLTIQADETVTFAAAKRGQVIFPGAGTVGKLHIAGIGLPARLPARDNVPLEMPAGTDIRELLPSLPLDSHKGTFGKVMIAAGSLNYTGAAGLAATAAYHAGAGLVTVAAPQPIIPVLATQIPEATWLLLPHDMGVIDENAADLLKDNLDGYSALLMGPGWGREETTGNFLRTILSSAAQKQNRRHIGFVPSHAEARSENDLSHQSLPPLVMDADGLNLLSEIEEWWTLLPSDTILTPHPGEMARLTGLNREEVQANRLELGPQKAVEWHCVVVLKGAFTVIAAPDGRAAVLPFAEPALATAGTGDVLAGAIVGLRGQALPPFEAALAAAYLHGLAGRLAVVNKKTARSVTARDVLNALHEAISVVERAV